MITKVDTLEFQGDGFTAQNLLLTQNGNNLEISFERDTYKSSFFGVKVILQNFALENLDNLSLSTGATVDLGNILFNKQTSITDSFDVFNANSTQSTIFNKNTVTFLNDLDNNVSGFDNSDDLINSQAGDDIIDGLSGNDLLRGGMGNDTLIGSAGDDTLIGDTGNNFLVGGIDNDSLNVEFSTGDNTLNGGAGDDTLSAEATSGDNLLFGGDGNDSLNASYYSETYSYIASNGNNTLNGGAGDDTFDVFDANSTQTSLFNRDTVTFLNDLSNNITGFDNSNDVINGQGGDDTIDGLSGNDTIRGGAGNDILIGNAGNDTLISRVGNDTLEGSTGDDSLSASGSKGDNLLSGGDGNDSLDLSGSYISDFGFFDSRSIGNNILEGGAGNDSLSARGSTGDNTLNGGVGDDFLSANISKGNNLLSGGDGNDSFSVSASSTVPSSLVTQTVDGDIGDVLSVNYTDATGGITSTFNATNNIGSITGGTNRVSYKFIEGLNIIGTTYDDLIVGSNGNDTIYGGNGNGGNGGNDTIIGGAGNDFLTGGYLGNNTLDGGNDILYGGVGNNNLYGGAGTDTFTFYYYNQGVSTIYDFNASNELIEVQAATFGGGLVTPIVSASQFTLGTSATTIAQRFIYDNSTGELFFDLDGSASGFTQVKFAQLDTGVALTKDNFVVV